MSLTRFWSRDVPIGIIVTGLGIAAASVVAVEQRAVLPRYAIVSVGIVLCGIGMLIFPGVPPPPETPLLRQWRAFIQLSPLRHRLIWILLGTVGCYAGYWLRHRLDGWLH